MGTYDIVVTNSSTSRGTGSIAISIGGAETTGSLGSVNSKYQAIATQNSLALVTTTDDSLVISALALNGTGRTITASGTNQTKQDEVTGECQHALSTQTTTSAGSYTNIWDFSSSQVSKQCVVEVLLGYTGGS